MTLALFVLLVLFLPVALAGLIYPFRPFRTRMRAAKAFGAGFLGLILVVAFGVPNETSTKQSEMSPAQEDRVAAIQEWREQSSPTPEKNIPAPKLEEEIAAEQEAARLAQIDEDIRSIYRSFETDSWHAVAHLFGKLYDQDVELSEHAAEIEKRVLAKVRPLPASDIEGNMKGYKLLTAIKPEDKTYAQKVVHYEQKRVEREKREEAERQAVVRRLKTNEDKVEGVTWYEHPNQPRYLNTRSTVYLYIGQKNGHEWLRMKTIYTASDWLFVDNVIAWHDGLKEPLVSGHFDRDNNSDIWEWRDENPSGYQIEVLRSLANAKEAILRFEGAQYRRDITLSSGDKKAIREVLMAYDIMKERS